MSRSFTLPPILSRRYEVLPRDLRHGSRSKLDRRTLHNRALNDGRIDSPFQPLPFRIRSNPDAIFHKELSIRKRHFGIALHFPAFEDRMVGSLMKLFVSNLLFDLWIKQNQISVAADLHRPFAWIEAEDHCRCGGK